MQAELRGEPSDQPAREPAETRGPTDVERVKDLTAAGDAKALDPRVRAYDPLEHVRARAGRDDAEPVPGGLGRLGLVSLRDKMRAASEERFGSPDTPDGSEDGDEGDGPDQVDEKR